MKLYRNLLFFLGLIAALPLLPGCSSLDATGPYHGDQVLYGADLTIVTSYDLVRTFLGWEKANRAALASLPAIHENAERIRAEYPRWQASALALRDTYAANPTSENRDALQVALTVLTQAMNEAAGYMAEAAKN